MTNTLDSATLSQVNALNNQGQYAEAYQLIAGKLLDALPITAPANVEDAKNFINDVNQMAWFYSASQVNSDSGFISGFIRGYASNADFPSQKLQDSFTKEQLDAASDAVAQKVLEEITKHNGEIPSVDKLLEIDKNTITTNLKQVARMELAECGAFRRDTMVFVYFPRISLHFIRATTGYA